MAISQNTLRQEGTAYRARNASKPKTASIHENFATTTKRKAFLCHSHKDIDLVEGLLEVFEKAGIDLYVDWKDNSMPDKPNEETARKIKEHISGSQVFLFLATSNAKASRWCPWEIGCADIGRRSIYIIPTSDSGGDYGNEYLELYPKIDAALLNNIPAGYAVFYPKSSGRQAKLLKDLVNEGGL